MELLIHYYQYFNNTINNTIIGKIKTNGSHFCSWCDMLHFSLVEITIKLKRICLKDKNIASSTGSKI